jgi:tetratricopeptide (TPR) repeat protein
MNPRLADRYTYVPLIGIFIILAWSGADLLQRRPSLKPFAIGSLIVAFSVYGWLSRQQISYWKDTAALFTRAVKVTRDNGIAHCNLGAVLLTQGKAAEAEPHLREAIRLQPSYGQFQNNTRNNLGTALVALGRIPEGIAEYEQVLKFAPDHAQAHMNLAVALQNLGQIDQATPHYEQALRLNPNDAAGHAAFGFLLSTVHQPGKAIEHYRAALRLKPDNIEVINNLAYILATDPAPEFRDGAEAVRLAEQGCAITRHQQPVLLGTLAAAYAEAGRFEDAVTTARESIQLALSRGQQDVAATTQRLL